MPCSRHHSDRANLTTFLGSPGIEPPGFVLRAQISDQQATTTIISKPINTKFVMLSEDNRDSFGAFHSSVFLL